MNDDITRTGADLGPDQGEFRERQSIETRWPTSAAPHPVDDLVARHPGATHRTGR